MTNKEAYNRDLEETIAAILTLHAAIPPAKNKQQEAERAKLADTAEMAIATLKCMSNDYVVKELNDFSSAKNRIFKLSESAGADILIALMAEQERAKFNGIDCRVKYLQPLIENVRRQMNEQMDN